MRVRLVHSYPHLVYDAIVVGGGPAGSVFASLVKRAHPDRRVLVLEKERFPRHHVGESLIAGIAPVLARAGVLSSIEALAETPSGVLRKAGIAYWWGENEGEGWTTDFRDPETSRPVIGTYQVDRATFDRVLLDHAIEAGADVVQGARVTSATRDEHWQISYELDGESHEVESPWVIDASGLARVMARATTTRAEPLDGMSNYAIYAYWDGSDAWSEGEPTGERDRWTFISTTELGWVWHIPLEGTRASVGLVTTRDALRDADDVDALYREQVRKARAWTLLESATLDSKPRVVRDWSSALRRTCGEGWLAIGDAAGFVDPILTSGMLLAITGASLAASFMETLWTDTELDEELLRESWDETQRDSIVAYHRLAHIWYRRNDKVRSWWWEARQQALRSSLAPDDRRSFLAASLGLSRDPHAAAAEPELAFEPVRPDKQLFAHHLFGDEDVVERTLGEQLTRLTALDVGERDARGAVYARLMERWRALLDAEIALVPLEQVERERYYCDRRMTRWKRARFIELRESAEYLDRVVLVAGPLLEILAEPGSLRDRLARRIAAGTSEGREQAERLWTQLVQLDMRDWLDGATPLPRGSPKSRTAIEQRVRELGNVCAFEVGLLGRTLTLHLVDAPTLELTFAPIERAWKRTEHASLGYRGELRSPEVLLAVAAGLRAEDAALVAASAGHCVELRDGRFAAVAPDQLSERRGRGSAT